MEYKVKIRELPACTVYYKRGEIDSFDDMIPFVLQSADECRAANPGIECTEDGYNFIAWLERPVDGKKIKLEYAQSVKTKGKETDTIKFRDLEPTKAVYVSHKGPYNGLADAYSTIVRWMFANGLKASDSPREWYISGPWEHDGEDVWEIEIEIPVDY